MDPAMDASSPVVNPKPLEEQAADAILAAIEASKSTMVNKIDSLALECGLVRQDLNKFRGHLFAAESRISKVEDTTASTSQTLADLQNKVKILMAHLEGTEKNNVATMSRWWAFQKGQRVQTRRCSQSHSSSNS